jgi:tetratricopeptide (TPR) repeat protein
LDERHLGTEFRWWPLQLLRYTGDTARAFRAVRTWRARVGWDTLPPAVRPYWILIPTLAEGGRVAEARRLLDEWRTLVPDDPRHRSDAYWSLGAIALAEGRLDSAAAAFLAWHDAPFAEDTHRYNRGLIEAGTALDRAGRPDTAIALYERALAIWTMDGVHYEATWYPLVLQRLAELHESLGNADRAIHYYGVFIDLWKDADPDLQPRVADASLALARLR